MEGRKRDVLHAGAAGTASGVVAVENSGLITPAKPQQGTL